MRAEQQKEGVEENQEYTIFPFCHYLTEGIKTGQRRNFHFFSLLHIKIPWNHYVLYFGKTFISIFRMHTLHKLDLKERVRGQKANCRPQIKSMNIRLNSITHTHTQTRLMFLFCTEKRHQSTN